MIEKHGHKTANSQKNRRRILHNFPMDGSHTCSPLFRNRFTSSGMSSADISHCPECAAVERYRTTCDSPRCGSTYCAETYGNDRGAVIADKIDMMKRQSGGAKMETLHIFVSPPQQEAQQWTQWGPHLEELYQMTCSIVRAGLGACAWSIVAHSHRGAKKDTDMQEAARWLDLGKPEGSGGGPYWRAGFHFHVLAVIFNPRSFAYMKAVCREIYRLTGFIVHVKRVTDTPENVIKYQLSHAAIFTREGSSRTMPALRSYGNFAHTKIQKRDLGIVIEARICPEDKTPLQVYAKGGTPSTVHRRVWGYMPRYPKGFLNPAAAEIAAVLDNIPPSPYWSASGRPIEQTILKKSDLEKLVAIDDLFIPKRLIPAVMLDRDPYEPDDYDLDDFPEIRIKWNTPAGSSEPEPVPEASQQPPDSLRIISPRGQIYDMLELQEFMNEGTRFLCKPDKESYPVKDPPRGSVPGEDPPEAQRRAGGPLPQPSAAAAMSSGVRT